MTKQSIIDSIHHVLSSTMGVSHLSAFSEQARLNEELYLDSVMVLHLIVHLELDLGFDIPEEALLEQQFATVGALAEFLLALPRSPARPDCPKEGII